MTEYIDKETMRSIIRDEESKHGLMGCAWIEMAMDRQPAADVEEVIRCKDCKHIRFSYGCGMCALFYHYPNGDWYCASGERKEGVDNG